jgi:hypothetical protein
MQSGTPRPLTPLPRGTGRADAIGVAVFAALTALVAWNRFSFDRWLSRHDLLTFFLPWYGALGDRLRSGDIPGWNPHIFSGTAFAGDPESGWMYLPAMLFFPFLSVLTAFKAMVAFQLVVAGLSTYAFSRVLGMGVVGSLVATTVFTFGPFLQHNTYCCTVRAQLATWIPMALLGIELALRAKRWRHRVAPWFLTGFAISQMFAGWTGQGVVLGLLVVASFLAYRAVVSPPPQAAVGGLRPRLVLGGVTGVAILGLGVALGAAGIFPRLETNQQTHLAGGDYSQLGQPHMAPPYPLDFLLVNLFGDGHEQRGIAIGGTALVLCLLAPFLAGRRFAVPYFLGLSLVVYILSLDTTPIHRLFYLIPRFQILHEHSPRQVLTVVLIGPTILCGAAVDSLWRWRGRRRLLPLVFTPLVLYGILAAALPNDVGFVGWPPLIAAAVVTILIALFVAAPPTLGVRSWSGRAVRLVPVLILAVAFLQPTGEDIVRSTLGRPLDPRWVPFWSPNPVYDRAIAVNMATTDPGGAGEFLQARQKDSAAPFRYVGYGGIGHPGDTGRGTYMDRRMQPNIQAILVNARAMRLGLSQIQGYNPLQFKRYVEFVTAINGRTQNYHGANLLPSGVRSPLLNLLNVRYILVDATLPPDRDDVVALTTGRREVFRNAEVVVYENPAALPYAWITHDVRSVAREDILPLLTRGDLDPRRTALVEGSAPETARPSDPAAESARLLDYEPDEIAFRTTATAPGLLVVSEVYAEGWRAYVDGEEVDLLPTNHVLRGVPIPAGEHRVELRYEPLALQLGLPISAVSTAAMLAVFAAAGWSS